MIIFYKYYNNSSVESQPYNYCIVAMGVYFVRVRPRAREWRSSGISQSARILVRCQHILHHTLTKCTTSTALSFNYM